MKFFSRHRKMLYQLWRILGVHCCLTCKHYNPRKETCEFPGERAIYIGWLLHNHRKESSKKNIGGRCQDWE